jgi:hypothetical protein
MTITKGESRLFPCLRSSARPQAAAFGRPLWSGGVQKVLLFSVLAVACLAVLRTVPLLLVPYQLDYGEGLMLEGGMRVRHSQALYPNPNAFPIVLHDWGH